MKITETSGVGKVPAAKKKQSSQSNGFSTLLGGDTDAPTQAPVISGVGALSSLDGLLGLQEIDIEAEDRRKQILHGQDLLQYLDELRIEMLQGDISVHTVKQILNETSAKNISNSDPKLKAIIDEIELRAQVELAKVEMTRKL